MCIRRSPQLSRMLRSVIFRLRAVGIVFVLPGSHRARNPPPPRGSEPSPPPTTPSPSGGYPLGGEGQILYKLTRHRPISLRLACFLLVACCVSRAYSFVGDFDVLLSFILLSLVESFVESFAGICAFLRAGFS